MVMSVIFPVVVSRSPERTTSKNSNACSPCTSRSRFSANSGSAQARAKGAMAKVTAKVGRAITAPHREAWAAASSWRNGCRPSGAPLAE